MILSFCGTLKGHLRQTEFNCASKSPFSITKNATYYHKGLGKPERHKKRSRVAPRSSYTRSAWRREFWWRLLGPSWLFVCKNAPHCVQKEPKFKQGKFGELLLGQHDPSMKKKKVQLWSRSLSAKQKCCKLSEVRQKFLKQCQNEIGMQALVSVMWWKCTRVACYLVLLAVSIHLPVLYFSYNVRPFTCNSPFYRHHSMHALPAFLFPVQQLFIFFSAAIYLALFKS